MSIRRPVSSSISPDLLQRVALAVLVLFWSVSPLLPWTGSGPGVAGPMPVAQAVPSGSLVLVGRTDTATRIAQWRPLGAVGLFDEADADGAEGDYPSGAGPALVWGPDGPVDASCTGFVTAHHAVSECARRSMRTAGRDPPVASLHA